MGKYFQRLGLSTIIFLLFFSPQVVSAYHQQEVLGESAMADNTDLSIPPTAEGPGLLLPDSPFFFLDQLKQTVRLALAFTPEQKAKIYSDIAGERMAELRLMLAKSNRVAADIALRGVSGNLQNAADQLSLAQLSGRDIFLLADHINTGIKRKQEALDILESQARGQIAANVNAVQQAVLAAKVEIEDSLTPTKLQNEIQDDLARELKKSIKDTSSSVKKVDRSLTQLQKQASRSGEILKKREEAVRKAIISKNEALIKAAQKRLEEGRKRLQELLGLQDKAAKEAREASQKLQDAMLRYKQLQDMINQLSATPSAQ